MSRRSRLPTLALWLLPLAASPPSLAAQESPRSLGQHLHIELAHDSERERAAAAALRRVVDAYDVERWVMTDSVVIDEEQIPHSHPVLTIRPTRPGDDAELVATFLHEQFHWLEDPDPGFEAAMAAFERIWPDAPGGPPEGARDRESTYRHLVVCDLELQAVTALFGEEAARATLAAYTHYTWIYATVLSDPRVREITTAHGMVVSRDFRSEYRRRPR